jgi:hypothetical protein
VITNVTVAYQGGALAPNGDIHFTPVQSSVGQKVSITGVVSTYPLVYWAPGAYTGAVLAPNGDIHFIPNNTNIGQKISTAGVVSTYSYSFTSSYFGGVLDKNGDIHFAPYDSSVGQKISTLPGTPLPMNVCLSPFLNKL